MGYNIIFTFIKLYLPGRKKNKMNEDLLVIKKNEVPAIQFNKEELIERVDEILEQHKGIIYTVNYLSHAVQKFLWKWLLTVVTITHL